MYILHIAYIFPFNYFLLESYIISGDKFVLVLIKEDRRKKTMEKMNIKLPKMIIALCNLVFC